jgi:hypothetical protein
VNDIRLETDLTLRTPPRSARLITVAGEVALGVEGTLATVGEQNIASRTAAA